MDRPPIPCYHLRVLIIANHLNGKDTHVRGLKVFGPSEPIVAYVHPHRIRERQIGMIADHDKQAHIRRTGHGGAQYFVRQEEEVG